MQDTLPAIVESRNRTNLSPFTWNHLALPPLNRTHNSIDIKVGIQKAHGKLAIITETKQNSKNAVVLFNKKLSLCEQTYSDNQADTTVMAGENKQVQRQHRYNSHSRGHRQINKTIDVIRDHSTSNKIESLLPNEGDTSKKIKMLNHNSNMENYIRDNLSRNGWKHTNHIHSKDARLLWANHDRFADHLQIKKGQYYNHIEGSATLTYKDRLHEQMQASGKDFYPRSFLIPKEYQAFMQQNNHIALKSMLRRISLEIL